MGDVQLVRLHLAVGLDHQVQSLRRVQVPDDPVLGIAVCHFGANLVEGPDSVVDASLLGGHRDAMVLKEVAEFLDLIRPSLVQEVKKMLRGGVADLVVGDQGGCLGGH